MKKNITVILILFSLTIYSQNILNIDNLKGKFKVEKYTLNTKELYNFNKTIEIYNIFINPNKLFLISVLPDLEKKDSWKKIDYNSISDKILTATKLENIILDWLNSNTPDKKTFEYKIIKKRGEDYYMAEVCLAEAFNIYEYSFPIISTYGTINIADSKVNIVQMKEIFEKLQPKQEFPLDINVDYGIKMLDNSYALRNYLSREYTIRGNKAYQFWTLDGWWTQDGYNKHRGIDRFVYIPEKGIVGGSYDFYFAYKPKLMYNNDVELPIPLKKLWQNIINEKVMIAEELK